MQSENKIRNPNRVVPEINPEHEIQSGVYRLKVGFQHAGVGKNVVIHGAFVS